jgi:hypothetical protein
MSTHWLFLGHLPTKQHLPCCCSFLPPSKQQSRMVINSVEYSNRSTIIIQPFLNPNSMNHAIPQSLKFLLLQGLTTSRHRSIYVSLWMYPARSRHPLNHKCQTGSFLYSMTSRWVSQNSVRWPRSGDSQLLMMFRPPIGKLVTTKGTVCSSVKCT